VQRPEGLYCPAGDFHIDPWRPVPRAVITHAHADHARRGHGAYLATAVSAGVLRARLGDITLQGLAYGEAVHINGVQVSLHPAGHVLGSAQVRVANTAARCGWPRATTSSAASRAMPTPPARAFEPVRCDCFITEAPSACPSTAGGRRPR
jgi:putative mRNA 3-end processing factor